MADLTALTVRVPLVQWVTMGRELLGFHGMYPWWGSAFSGQWVDTHPMLLNLSSMPLKLVSI